MSQSIAGELLEVADFIVQTEPLVVNANLTQVSWSKADGLGFLALSGGFDDAKFGINSVEVDHAIFVEGSVDIAARIRIKRGWDNTDQVDYPFAEHILERFQQYIDNPLAFVASSLSKLKDLNGLLDGIKEPELWIPSEAL